MKKMYQKPKKMTNENKSWLNRYDLIVKDLHKLKNYRGA